MPHSSDRTCSTLMEALIRVCSEYHNLKKIYTSSDCKSCQQTKIPANVMESVGLDLREFHFFIQPERKTHLLLQATVQPEGEKCFAAANSSKNWIHLTPPSALFQGLIHKANCANDIQAQIHLHPLTLLHSSPAAKFCPHTVNVGLDREGNIHILKLIYDGCATNFVVCKWHSFLGDSEEKQLCVMTTAYSTQNILYITGCCLL